jgi:RNA polymerase sigma-32 factor
VRSWSLVRLGTSTAHRALFFRLRRKMSDLRGGAEQIGDDVIRSLATKFRVPIKEVAALARRATGFDRSRHESSGPDGTRMLEEGLADPRPNPEDEAALQSGRRYASGLLARAMRALSQRERLIIQERYIAELAKTRDALGRELGISAERVRQLERNALEKLRRLLAPLRTAL